ncbi:MAG: hypothetical protein IBX50_19125 [Marinospirillum sp.]|uniref:hypothetical protein n=1 Tax=Marinospirillum sp. TaxID=2183934 RepID=UPI0019E91BBC|nr:hypothetical protein [Marinospirillum sp.]MBE0508803.1 hypothetical protein [Marinospirillum sp.]
MTECLFDGCEKPAHADGCGYCARHASKEKMTNALQEVFEKELLIYISGKIYSLMHGKYGDDLQVGPDDIILCLHFNENDYNWIAEKLSEKKSLLSIEEFVFPDLFFVLYDPGKANGYLFKILSIFDDVVFKDCVFYHDIIRLSKVTYTNCVFKWCIDFSCFTDFHSYIVDFYDCIFCERVELVSGVFSGVRFDGGSFRKGMYIEDVEFELPVFIGANDYDFFYLSIKDSRFKKEVSLNGSQFGAGLLVDNVIFDGWFEARDSVMGDFDIKDANFNKFIDISGGCFDSFAVSHVAFFGYFSMESSRVISDRAVFYYASFSGHASFRGSKFFGGLDLDRADFSGEANFLGVDADGGNIKNTTRETYRLIKHSFDKIGNHLEANKFFAKEMDKYREEVSGNKSLPLWDRAVFHINKNASDFGQNYLLPLVWLVYFSSVFYFLYWVHDYEKWLETPQKFTCGASGYYANINCFASKFTPFKQFLVPGMEFLSLIFYVIFAILIWQTVVALKRHTRR